jgi:hypothetical protein
LPTSLIQTVRPIIRCILCDGHAQFDRTAPAVSHRRGQSDEATESFCIGDANKQALAFVYCEDEPGRRIATNIAKLPELLRKPPK